MAQRLEDLLVWQRAIPMSIAVYKATGTFPTTEKYGLSAQLQRAAVSVASNIAEGRGRLNNGEFRQFLGVAQGSNYEVQTQIVIAQKLGIGNDGLLTEAQELSTEVGGMLTSFIATVSAKS